VRIHKNRAGGVSHGVKVKAQKSSPRTKRQKLTQEDHEFKANLSYLAKPCLKIPKRFLRPYLANI
jgi:hypothetical protein